MAIQEGYFIVDGVFHTDLPVAFGQLTDDNYGVADNAIRVADGKKVITVTASPINDHSDYRDYVHRRKILVQSWKADWGEKSLMTVFMAEQLRELYETQKGFWIQFDDEMSRCWGRLIGFNADLEDGNRDHVLFAPHYPIFPYGHEPGDSYEDWTGMLWVANRIWSGEFTVHSDYGMVVLPADNKKFNDRIKVHLKYTWRAYVRIREMDLQPFELAQTYYSGEVVFEQIDIPVSGVALEWKTPPYTSACTYYARVRTKTFAQVAIVAYANAYTWNNINSSPQARIGALSVRATAHATKTSSAIKTGRIAVSPISIVIPTGGGKVTVYVDTVPEVAVPQTTTGTGWASNISTKADYAVVSDADPSSYVYGSTFSQKFNLSPVTDPNRSTGHSISVQWKRLTPATTKLTIYLLQGDRVIAQPQFTRSSDGVQADSYTLSGAEADSITDYSNLSFKFLADYQAGAVWIGLQLPAAVVKYGSAFGTIAVRNYTRATRTFARGYPVLAQIKIQSACGPVAAYKINVDYPAYIDNPDEAIP